MKHLLISLAMIVCLDVPAAAAPRTHPEGFSLDVPDDWKFSDSEMPMGTRWNLSKIDPADDHVGVILSVYVAMEAEAESLITDLGKHFEIPDLTWTAPQKATFDGISGTKRTGKAKSSNFFAITLETSAAKRVVLIGIRLGRDRQQRLELELIVNSLKRVPMKTTTFPLSDGVALDLPTTWSLSKGKASKPFNGMEWLLMSNMDEKAPKAVIFMREIDQDKLDAGLKAWEDEDKAKLGPVTWGSPRVGAINGVRVTTRQGKQTGTPITLVIVETSPTTCSILWAMPVALDPAALEPQLKAVLASLRKR